MLLVGYAQNHGSGGDAPDAVSTSSTDPAAAFTVTDLPKEAQETLALIDRGGPYPYRQDNAVFGNRERLLPAKSNGYYHEFTVMTPGEADRGPRRLVRGAEGETYYTSDHYASFHLVERN